MISEDEILIGIIVKTTLSHGEELIKKLERDPRLRIIYVKRTTTNRYLLLIEAERIRKEGNVNANHR